MIDSLTAFDAGVLIIILLSMLFAFGRGFVTVALSLAAWVGAFFIATGGFTYAQSYGRELIQPKELADILVLVLLFFASLALLRWMADWIGRAVKDSPVGFLDRSLGALFGLARGAVIVSLAFLAYSKFTDPEDEPVWIQEAKLRPIVAWSAEMAEKSVYAVLGEDTPDRGQAILEQTRDQVRSQFQQEALEQLVPDYKSRKELGDLSEALAGDDAAEDDEGDGS